jgi:hypothetical protein
MGNGLKTDMKVGDWERLAGKGGELRLREDKGGAEVYNSRHTLWGMTVGAIRHLFPSAERQQKRIAGAIEFKSFLQSEFGATIGGQAFSHGGINGGKGLKARQVTVALGKARELKADLIQQNIQAMKRFQPDGDQFSTLVGIGGLDDQKKGLVSDLIEKSVRRHPAFEKGHISDDEIRKIAQGAANDVAALKKLEQRPDVKVSLLSPDQSDAILTQAKFPAHHNPLSSLGKPYASPVPEVGVDGLKQAGLGPKFTITTSDQKIHVSDPYDIGDGRIGLVAYVEHEGQTYVRSFYRSNSRGDWQSASHHGDVEEALDKKDPQETLWIGKGAGGGKSSTVLPIEAQKSLCVLVDAAPLKIVDGKDLKVNWNDGTQDHELQIKPGERIFYGILPFGSNESFKKEINEDWTARRLYDPQKVHTAKDLDIPHGLEPDFGQLKDKFPVKMSEHYSKNCMAYVFDGKRQNVGTQDKPHDIQLRYMFIREEDTGRVFLAGMDDIAAPVNSFGVRQCSVDPHELGTGLIEYDVMLGGMLAQYSGNPVKGTPYVEVTGFHENVPLIRDAKQAIDKL